MIGFVLNPIASVVVALLLTLAMVYVLIEHHESGWDVVLAIVLAVLAIRAWMVTFLLVMVNQGGF